MIFCVSKLIFGGNFVGWIRSSPHDLSAFWTFPFGKGEGASRHTM